MAPPRGDRGHRRVTGRGPAPDDGAARDVGLWIARCLGRRDLALLSPDDVAAVSKAVETLRSTVAIQTGTAQDLAQSRSSPLLPQSPASRVAETHANLIDSPTTSQIVLRLTFRSWIADKSCESSVGDST